MPPMNAVILASCIPLFTGCALTSRLTGSSSSPSTTPAATSGPAATNPVTPAPADVAEPVDDTASRQRGAAFDAEARKVDLALLAIHAVKQRTRPIGIKDFERLIEKGQTLAALDHACRETYGGGEGIRTFANPDGHLHPVVACNLAGSWQPILSLAAKESAAAHSTRAIAGLESALARLEADGILYPHDEKAFADPASASVVARLEPVTAALGPVVDDDFGALSAVAERFPAALVAAATKDRWPDGARHHDAAAEKAIRAAAREAGLEVVKSALVVASAEIERNDLGLPVRTVRSGVVLGRARGERFCRIHDVTAYADHVGGGRYNPPQARLDRLQQAALISACP